MKYSERQNLWIANFNLKPGMEIRSKPKEQISDELLDLLVRCYSFDVMDNFWIWTDLTCIVLGFDEKSILVKMKVDQSRTIALPYHFFVEPFKNFNADDLTETQQKCINLIKSDQNANIALAIQISDKSSQDIEYLYWTFYQKWRLKFLLEGKAREMMVVSPIQMLLLTSIQYCHSIFKSEEEFLEYIKDYATLLPIENKKLEFNIGFLEKVEKSDYAYLLDLQDRVSKIIQKDKSLISFYKQGW